MRFALAPRLAAAATAVMTVATSALCLTGTASAATTVSTRSFGIHQLNPAHPLLVQFGASRIWDMGVTWKKLQPRKGHTSPSALARLDSIVASQRAHGSQPLITLGMTPAWAAHKCNHYSGGVNWGLQTCAPVKIGAYGAWGSYVRMLAKRYRGKVSYFELWNEPSLRNGYNDSVRTLAKMQATAQSILHHYGEKLVSPAIPFTDGSPNNGLNWLNSFLRLPGGKAFDIVGLHLYPSDAAARAGYGPEWSMQALGWARSVLRRNNVANKPVWDTETNVGRIPAHTAQGGGSRGAAMVARTFVLATQHGVSRTFWYAADDRRWGGTWLESKTAKSLTTAGHAYATVQNLLVGARPRGCTQTSVGSNKWHVACRYRLANGKGMVAVWSTSGAFTYHGPKSTHQVVGVAGGSRTVSHSTALRIGAAPQYVIGTFNV